MIRQLTTRTQSILNRQLVDEADIVVGLFHSRLGQPTSRGASGTAEEIDRSVERGVKVHVFSPRCLSLTTLISTS